MVEAPKKETNGVIVRGERGNSQGVGCLLIAQSRDKAKLDQLGFALILGFEALQRLVKCQKLGRCPLRLKVQLV
jgi:hypothetical protein